MNSICLCAVCLCVRVCSYACLRASYKYSSGFITHADWLAWPMHACGTGCNFFSAIKQGDWTSFWFLDLLINVSHVRSFGKKVSRTHFPDIPKAETSFDSVSSNFVQWSADLSLTYRANHIMLSEIQIWPYEKSFAYSSCRSCIYFKGQLQSGQRGD